MQYFNQIFTPNVEEAVPRFVIGTILLSVFGPSIGDFGIAGDEDGKPDLLLEDANYRFYELGEAIIVKSRNVIFLLNAAGVDENQIFRNHTSFRSAYLTNSGLVTKTNQGRGNIFGSFYYDKSDNIFIPFCQDQENDVIATKKSFYENQLIRHTLKLKIDIIIDDYTEAEHLHCYRYLLKNIFYQTNKASVALISLGLKSNEAVIDFVKKLNNNGLNETSISETKATPGTILEAIKIAEFFPLLRKDTLSIPKENLMQETLDLWRRATEVKLINNLESIRRNIEEDLRSDYRKYSYSKYELHYVRDISVYFPALKAVTIENVMDYYQRLNKILGVSNNFVQLRKLLIFFRYIKRMDLENKHVQLSRIRFNTAINEVDHFLLRVIQWNAYRNSIYAALSHDNVQLLNLMEGSKNGEDLREKLCEKVGICWKTRLHKFEKTDLESVKNNANIKVECEMDCLWIVGSIISFKTISKTIETSNCNYNIVKVIAFEEINIDGEIFEAIKKKLLILSPKWSINKVIKDENVSTFYEGICDPWLVDPDGGKNKSACSILKTNPEGVCWNDEGYFSPCGDLLKDEHLPGWTKTDSSLNLLIGDPVLPSSKAERRVARAFTNALSIIISAAKGKNKEQAIKILQYARKNLENKIGELPKLAYDVKIPLNYFHAIFLEYIEPVEFEPKPIRNLQSFGEKLRDYVNNLREKNEIYRGVVMAKTLDDVREEMKLVTKMFKKITPQLHSALESIPQSIADILSKIPKTGVEKINITIVQEISSLLTKYLMFEIPKRNEFLSVELGWPTEKIVILIPRAAYAAMKIVVDRVKKLAVSFRHTEDDKKRFDFINKVTTALRLGQIKKYFNKFNATYHYLEVVQRLKCEAPYESPTAGCGHLSEIMKELKDLNEFCSGIKDWGPEPDIVKDNFIAKFHVDESELVLDCKEKFLQNYRRIAWKSQIIEVLPDESDLGCLIRFRAQLEKIYSFLGEKSVPHLAPLARGFKESNEAVNYWVEENWYSWRQVLKIYDTEVKNLHKGTRLVGFPRTLTGFKRHLHSPLGEYGRGLLLLPTFTGEAAKYKNLTTNLQKFLSKYSKLLDNAKDAFRNEIFDQHLKNININKQFEASLPPDTAKIVKKLDGILRTELMMNKGKEARIALRQFLFPFPDNVKNYWTSEVIKAIESITNTTFGEDFEITQKVKNRPFDLEVCSNCPPFFFWSFEKYIPCETSKNSFLIGRSSITLNANVLLQKNIYQALKGRNFNIRLVPNGNRESLYWKEDMAEISKALAGTSAELTHEGNAFTIYDNKIYRTLTEPIKIILGTYIDGKFDNSINEIVGSNPLPLSPYSKWTIRLKHINTEQADKLLDISHLIAGIELIGDGAFIQSNGNSHKTEGNYEPVIEYEIYDETESDFLF